METRWTEPDQDILRSRIDVPHDADLMHVLYLVLLIYA
jgi:hypothetical protein